MARFLSPEWLADLAAAATGASGPDEEPFTLQQVVVGPPDVAWAVTVGAGKVIVEVGRVDSPTVTFSQDVATAAAIHRGELSAQAAFMTGRLRVGGDVRALLERQGTLAELDDTFGPVRRATTY